MIVSRLNSLDSNPSAVNSASKPPISPSKSATHAIVTQSFGAKPSESPIPTAEKASDGDGRKKRGRELLSPVAAKKRRTKYPVSPGGVNKYKVQNISLILRLFFFFWPPFPYLPYMQGLPNIHFQFSVKDNRSTSWNLFENEIISWAPLSYLS